MSRDITILPDEEKIALVASIYSETNQDSIDEEDIYDLISKHSFKTTIQIKQGISAMAYIRLREMEGYTRVDAFKKVFPDRWTREDTDRSIGARARRLESTDTYKKIIVEMQMNFYNVFAIERIAAVNETLRRAYTDEVGEKYNFEYMKLFLESTKKPEDAKMFEVNVNVESGGVSIADVEDRLNDIATLLDGSSQSDIIDAILVDKSSDDTA